MKVSDLVEALSKVSPDVLVVVESHDYGYDDPVGVLVLSLGLTSNPGDVLGKYEDRDPRFESDLIDAVCLS